MFKKSFDVLQKRFKETMLEYWEIRKRYGVGITTTRNFNALPPEFIREREIVLDKYWNVFEEERKSFNELNQSEHAVEVAEALSVFSKIESSEEFKVFLDLFDWMPANIYKVIFRELLTSKNVERLRQLIKNVPVVTDSYDMDECRILKASGKYEIFSKLLIILHPVQSAH